MSKEEDDAELQQWLALTNEEWDSLTPEEEDRWAAFVGRVGMPLEEFKAKYLP